MRDEIAMVLRTERSETHTSPASGEFLAIYRFGHF